MNVNANLLKSETISLTKEETNEDKNEASSCDSNIINSNSLSNVNSEECIADLFDEWENKLDLD